MPNTLSMYALKADGTDWSWGLNSDGQLGDWTTTHRSSPVSVVGNHIFAKAHAGYYMGLGRKPSGQVWDWGRNLTFGNLGDNTTISKSSPISVVGGHVFTDLAAGQWFTVALKANGEAWSWGRNNDEGQLGDYTKTSRSSPVSVVGNHSFIYISCHEVNAIALKGNGQAWTWGNNIYGQIGDQTNIDRSSPVAVVGNHSFVRIGAGLDHATGLKSDGYIWNWGLNSSGQLGTFNIIPASSPVAVVGNHKFVLMSVGDGHTIGLKQNGQAWTWGLNDNGQLGDNTMSNRSSPILVIGNHSFIRVVATHLSSYGLKENGQIWSWGANVTYGSLGDGTTTNRSSPVLVIGGHVFASMADQMEPISLLAAYLQQIWVM